MIKRLFSNIIILSVLCFFLSAMNSFAWEITLEWDPPDNPTDVTGYMVHYGTDSGAYSMSVDVGNTTSYTVSNLIDGETYIFRWSLIIPPAHKASIPMKSPQPQPQVTFLLPVPVAEVVAALLPRPPMVLILIPM